MRQNSQAAVSDISTNRWTGSRLRKARAETRSARFLSFGPEMRIEWLFSTERRLLIRPNLTVTLAMSLFRLPFPLSTDDSALQA